MTDTASPFTHFVLPADVPPSGLRLHFGADAAAAAALATRADALAVDGFRAEFEVKPWSGTGFLVTGRITARLTQSCVVTLEPVETAVDETVDLKLVPPEDMAKYELSPDENGEVDLVALTDRPEPIEDGRIDLGALAVEHFLLGVDPYPRKPGAVFDADAAGVGNDPSTSPFAALARLGKE